MISTSFAEKEPYPNSLFIISSDAHINPRLAELKIVEIIVKPCFEYQKPRKIFNLIVLIELAMKLPTAIPAIARLI